MKQVADQQMVENALGEDYDSLMEPPQVEAPREDPLWPAIRKALQDVYDPEIPVNIYELGLIYLVEIQEDTEESSSSDSGESVHDLYVRMTLTSPACPVAQEMPGWVQSALFALDGVGQVDVEIIWDPPWDPSFMAETAKLQLNMFT